MSWSRSLRLASHERSQKQRGCSPADASILRNVESPDPKSPNPQTSSPNPPAVPHSCSSPSAFRSLRLYVESTIAHGPIGVGVHQHCHTRFPLPRLDRVEWILALTVLLCDCRPEELEQAISGTVFAANVALFTPRPVTGHLQTLTAVPIHPDPLLEEFPKHLPGEVERASWRCEGGDISLTWSSVDCVTGVRLGAGWTLSRRGWDFWSVGRFRGFRLRGWVRFEELQALSPWIGNANAKIRIGRSE